MIQWPPKGVQGKPQGDAHLAECGCVFGVIKKAEENFFTIDSCGEELCEIQEMVQEEAKFAGIPVSITTRR